jgi:hypothetical protein
MIQVGLLVNSLLDKEGKKLKKGKPKKWLKKIGCLLYKFFWMLSPFKFFIKII